MASEERASFRTSDRMGTGAGKQHVQEECRYRQTTERAQRTSERVQEA